MWIRSYYLFSLWSHVLGVVVQCFILNRFRKYNFTFVDQFILSYGGLRGAIAYGIAVSMPSRVEAKDMFITTSIAVIYFTVFVQGFTIRPIVNWLKVERKTKKKETFVVNVFNRVSINMRDETIFRLSIMFLLELKRLLMKLALIPFEISIFEAYSYHRRCSPRVFRVPFSL